MNRGGDPVVFPDMRTLRTGIVSVLVLALFTGTAMAGGSHIEPYRESYQPGETVVLRGNVSSGQLGWIDDGPFYAYLRVDPDAGAGANRFPNVDESDIPLGELQVQELDSGWAHVSIIFTLPTHIGAGVYSVVYCNDPCTEGLGDLMGGWVRVVEPVTPNRSYPTFSPFFFPV